MSGYAIQRALLGVALLFALFWWAAVIWVAC